MDVLLAAVAGLVVGTLVAGALAWSAAQRRAESAVRRASVEQARLQARLDAAVAGAEAARADEQRLAEQFRALASDALSASSEQFLALAQQRLAAEHQTQVSELVQREQAVRAMVEPLGATLERVRAGLAEAERERAAGAAALGEQVEAMRREAEQLRGQTGRLATALRSSHVRGRWGEMQLRRVVEASGMLPHVDFVEQPSVRTDDGALRPDMVVRLAGGRHVVVDAKVAFLGFLDAANAEDERERAERLAAHARHVRRHVDDLAGKRYWDQFAPAPEFVVMFVPAESFLHAAVEQDPTLLEHAFAHDVVVATPSTLLALLRTIAYGWRQDALATNAQQVLTLGKELHGRLATLGGHVAKLGRAIESTATAYNQVVGSLETRVLVSARRFADLHVVDAELAAPAAVDPRLATLGAPELVASAEDQLVELDGRALRDERALAAERRLVAEHREPAGRDADAG